MGKARVASGRKMPLKPWRAVETGVVALGTRATDGAHPVFFIGMNGKRLAEVVFLPGLPERSTVES